jgi:hypothetical protein
MIGNKYGKLTVLKLDEEKSKNGRKYYLCECECGNIKSVRSDCLTSGNTKSCGCALNDYFESRTQYTKEKLYHVWAGMKSRCNNSKANKYCDYGGRGIKVYDKWNGEHDYLTFRTWAYENGYREGLSLDRIDVNGNYEPSNCRWVTQKVQTRNTRVNRNITYKGETHVLQDWAKILNINPNTLYHRIVTLGWEIEEAFENKSNNNYKHGLDKANEKNKKEYNVRCEKIRSRVIELKDIFTFKELLNIIKSEFDIKRNPTVYKACCGSPRKCDFVKWMENL